jgi:hypothetical protein
MKSIYEAPMINFIALSAEDTITTSNGSGNVILPDDDF